MLTETEKAYFAGLMDGEGYFTVNYKERKNKISGSTYMQMDVMAGIGMTDPGPIYKLHQEYGGSFTKRKIDKIGNFPMYSWRIVACSFDTFVNDILPYLQIKKRQAEIAIELRAMQLNRVNKYAKLTNYEKNSRIVLIKSLKIQKNIKEII